MPSQVLVNPNGIFVWIDQPFQDDAFGFLNTHLPPVGKEVPIFVFIERSGSGDMETYFFEMHTRGYDVRFRAMHREDERMLQVLKMPTHHMEWPG